MFKDSFNCLNDVHKRCILNSIEFCTHLEILKRIFKVVFLFSYQSSVLKEPCIHQCFFKFLSLPYRGDLIIISPHQYNVNSFFKLFWNFLNFLFFHASTSFLDFFVPFLCINVQSNQLWLLFWTSSCLPSASTSNPNSFDFFFGLHRAFPPLQRPIQPASIPFQIRNFKNDSYSYWHIFKSPIKYQCCVTY